MDVRRTWLVKPIMVVMEELWPHLSDDHGLRFEDYRPPMHDDYRWYAGYEGDELVGVFCASRQSHITWEVHAQIRPKYWGNKYGTTFCKAALAEVFADTGAQKIVAQVADCYPEVQAMGEALGFVREGVNKSSYQRGGKVYDQTYFGIREPNV